MARARTRYCAYDSTWSRGTDCSPERRRTMSSGACSTCRTPGPVIPRASVRSSTSLSAFSRACRLPPLARYAASGAPSANPWAFTTCRIAVAPPWSAAVSAHDVPVSQIAEPDPFDPGEDPLDLEQSGILSVGQVDLRLVTRDHRARVHAQAREEHLHLHASRVLSLIENHEGVGQGATTHVRK